MNIIIKKRIFDRLYEKPGHATIIDCEYTIWFVDRDKEYWYLEYGKSGDLWWREEFFKNYKYFKVLSIEKRVYEKIIAEWVEEVLNCKVDAIDWTNGVGSIWWKNC